MNKIENRNNDWRLMNMVITLEAQKTIIYSYYCNFWLKYVIIFSIKQLFELKLHLIYAEKIKSCLNWVQLIIIINNYYSVYQSIIYFTIENIDKSLCLIFKYCNNFLIIFLVTKKTAIILLIIIVIEVIIILLFFCFVLKINDMIVSSQ